MCQRTFVIRIDDYSDWNVVSVPGCVCVGSFEEVLVRTQFELVDAHQEMEADHRTFQAFLSLPFHPLDSSRAEQGAVSFLIPHL